MARTPDNMTTLSLKRAAFVDAYVATGNATEAAKQANYGSPQSQGSRLLKNAEIQQAVNRKREALATAGEYSIAQWVADLREDIADAKASRNHSAVLKGREMLGKHIGALNSQSSGDAARDQAFGMLQAAMTAGAAVGAASMQQARESAGQPAPEPTTLEVSGSVVGEDADSAETG